jgi:hypothetical protein
MGQMEMKCILNIGKKYFYIGQGYSGERCGPWASCFSLLIDIHLIFGTLLCHTKIQIKYEFGFDPLIFTEVMALGLRKISRIISFPDFFLSACRYSFDNWYIALPYQDTDQV